MEYNERPFGELFAEGTRNGLTRPKAVRGSGVKMVNMGELFAFPRLQNAPMDRVPLSRAEAQRSLLQPGDLLFARQSLVLEGAGKCSIFLGDDEQVTFESHVTRVRLDPHKADAKFYFYYLQSHHGRMAIRSIVEQGAGASGIRGSDLSRLNVLWRPLPQQRAIAHILDTLDDKIELNRRMNETLEEMARVLFQSWFVDFDPVRVKAKGHDPGLPHHLADLFPSSFEDSELGEIPRGWEVQALGELADVNWGDTSTTKKAYVTEGFTAYSAAGPDGLLPYYDYNRTGIVVSAIGSAGLSWLSLGKWSCIKNTIRFWATASGISTEYLYHATKGKEKWPMRGSVQLFISQGDARAMRILAPANELAEHFGQVVRPWFAKIEANKTESRTLATLRDTLLPKLISGALRVKDVEHFLGSED